MALTHVRAQEIAENGKLLCDDLLTLYWRMQRFLLHNSAHAIDWGGQNKPSAVNEDVNGNIDGTRFTRQQLSNAIGTISGVATLLSADGNAHLGNLEQLAESRES